MSDFVALNAFSQRASKDVLFFDKNASAENLLDNAITRIEYVMQMHAAIADLPPDTTINAVPFSVVSALLLSDSFSLLLALQERTEQYGDVRDIIQRHAKTYADLISQLPAQQSDKPEVQNA